MIDVNEYDKFLEAEARLRGRPHRGNGRIMVFDGKRSGYWASADILVVESGTPFKYDYFLHPRFGVVKALNDGGTLICKSPLCEQLDKEIFEL